MSSSNLSECQLGEKFKHLGKPQLIDPKKGAMEWTAENSGSFFHQKEAIWGEDSNNGKKRERGELFHLRKVPLYALPTQHYINLRTVKVASAFQCERKRGGSPEGKTLHSGERENLADQSNKAQRSSSVILR